MRTAPLFAFAAVMTVAAMPVAAQENVDRYQLEKTADGYVRMDTVTGRMSTCVERGEQLVCRMATEDVQAYEGDIDALQKRVETLEKRLAAFESGRPSAALPNDQEFEQTLGYMERFFRRFMGIVKEFETEHETAPVTPDPDRT